METELHNFEKGSGFVQTSTGINKSDIKRDFHDLLRKWYVNDNGSQCIGKKISVVIVFVSE